MRTVLALVAVVVLAGCSHSAGSGVEAPPTVALGIRVHSVFAEGGPIPRRFACDGAGDVPVLRWEGVPASARALALVVDDPDAPAGIYTHWVVLDMPRSTRGLNGRTLPAGAVQGSNSAGDAAWTPPCPPNGDAAHHYRFTVYALDAETGLHEGASISEVNTAIGAHAVARGTLTGTYTRS